VARRLGTIAERVSDEPFDVEKFLDVMGAEKISDFLDQGHEQVVPGIAAFVTVFGSIFHIARPVPHTHILLKIEERFCAAAEEFAARYTASDKQSLGPIDHLDAGLVLAALGRHDEALEAYGRVNGASMVGLALCFMGISLACMNMHEEACRACEGSLRLMPDLSLAGIALRTYRRALKSPGRHLREPWPLVVFLAMGDEPACGTCSRHTRDPGHISLGSPVVVSFKQGKPHCASITLLRLCYARGLCDIGAFRRTHLGLCVRSSIELGALLIDPHAAEQIKAMGPLVEIGARHGVSAALKALSGLLGGRPAGAEPEKGRGAPTTHRGRMAMAGRSPS